MRKDKLNDYVSGIDDAFIRESASVRGRMKLRKAGIIVSAMKIAACLLLAVGITTATIFLPQMRKPGAGGSTDVTGSDVTSGDNTGIGHDRRYIGFTAHDVSRCFPYYPGTYSGLLYRVATKDVTDYTAYVIASVADLEDYIDGYQAMMKNEPGYRKPDTEALAEIRNRYGESYFESRDLIFLPVRDATISVTFRIMSLTEKNGAVTLDVRYYEPEVGDCCEQEFCAAIETEEKLKCDSVNVNFRSEAGQNPTSERDCLLIWSNFNPEKAKFGNKSSFTISELSNAVFKTDKENNSVYLDAVIKFDKENNSVYLDGELLAKFFCITDIYLCDITGDGIPEMCFNIAFGSGLTDFRISAIDCSTGKTIFSLSDRGQHDYTFSEENGSLIIVERGGLLSDNVTRTGTLTYDGGGNVSIDWGRSVSTKAYCFNIDTLTDVAAHPFTVLRSRSDVENYIIHYPQTEKDYIELKSCFDRYDEEFFRTNYLAVVSTALGSSMYRPEIDSVIDSWNGLKVTIAYTAPEGDVTTDILPITAVIPIAGQIADNSAYDLNILEK